MPERILIVEDEEKIARFVELELLHEGYEAEKAGNGRDGLELAESGRFDLVLLDIMLPDLSGLEVLRRLRKSSQLPVILLTARDAVADKVSGLDMGADDYITKPFSIEELLARIRVTLRRRPQGGDPDGVLRAGELTLDKKRHSVSYGGTAVALTAREFSLLQELLENKGIVMSRNSLLERVWGYDYVGETNIVEVYIRYLRSKIDDVFGIPLIQTIRGVGYVIKEDSDHDRE
ncbi:MAG: response regulator transcription factor [Clostridiales bacterium]|nr:response regulator transcription factor [Clostridiales bacterium]